MFKAGPAISRHGESRGRSSPASLTSSREEAQRQVSVHRDSHKDEGEASMEMPRLSSV